MVGVFDEALDLMSYLIAQQEQAEHILGVLNDVSHSIVILTSLEFSLSLFC